MKVISLVSGIGAFEKELSNLNIKYELISYCEIDKYASSSYVAESLNLGDSTQINIKKLLNKYAFINTWSNMPSL